MAARHLAPALLALAGGAAAAQASDARDLSWGASAGVQHRRLVERADDGSRLVEETGEMLRLGVDGTLRFASGGALRAGAEVAGGVLDYDGRTQTGVPLTTDTRHSEFALHFGWRPWAPMPWGEAWLVVRGLAQRRDIRSTSSATGLQETSTLLMPGLRWTADFAGGGWHWRPSAEIRSSVWHRVDVDFLGLYDTKELHGGHRTEVALGLEAAAGNSPWSWALEWTRARQSASDWETLYRGGAAVGLVRQPRIAIDDVALRVRRAF